MSKLYIKKRYGQIPNDILNNKEISLKAKGLWVYMQSKPDGWTFSVLRIASQLKEGKSAIQEAIKELEKNELLVRRPIKNKEGKWKGYDYILLEKPLTENQPTDKRLTENIATISKKEYSKKDNSKKEKQTNRNNKQVVNSIGNVLKTTPDPATQNIDPRTNEEKNNIALKLAELLVNIKYSVTGEKDKLTKQADINSWKKSIYTFIKNRPSYTYDYMAEIFLWYKEHINDKYASKFPNNNFLKNWLEDIEIKMNKDKKYYNQDIEIGEEIRA